VLNRPGERAVESVVLDARAVGGTPAVDSRAPGADLMAGRPAPIPTAVAELWELVVAYFKQETTEPLKSLWRVIAFGIAGSLLIGVGVVFIAIGALRLLQAETDVFQGNWTFVPYVIVITGLMVAGAAMLKIGLRTKEPRP
jgi:hypothetical protein